MKTVLITGANKGIGFETTRQLAKLGYHVYLGCRSRSHGTEAVEKLNAEGFNNVDLLEIDVTDLRSIQSARKELESSIDHLDVLINNAGIAGKQPQNISSCEMENLRGIFETNFFGAVQTTQELVNLLKKSDEPRIVNVSSQLASLEIQNSSQNPNHRIYDAYSASKTALNAFTVLLAREFDGTNFKINSVEPGYTATDLNNFMGTQSPKQAAEIIVKYATLDKEGPTGSFFRKDGKVAW
ncbi:SDR family oxidoreductase [Chryseobacterium sp. PTM-20240506]|uniref:SDR family oxidoreductase n=1 Tax=unclassified Chryseobacterium TaxID=2593645 RepID=UPI002359E281|nr:MULTISPECIES: SDR family oxidoreductase [unclassified Chryseobacterium]MDC8103932.1 SDR family oxidoreductase [Chryseobacterium sp. B21-037]MDQ1803538.1 SDR family oxidoreductase [Chryseobacterium sp. CKR4-1]